MMKSDEIWWKHRFSSDFIRFHQFSFFWYFLTFFFPIQEYFWFFFLETIFEPFVKAMCCWLLQKTTWKLNAFCQGKLCFQNWNMLCFPRSQTNVHLNSLWWFPKMFWWQMGPLTKGLLYPLIIWWTIQKWKQITHLWGAPNQTPLAQFFFCCNPASIHEPFAKVSHCSATASWALTNIVDHTSMYTYICLCMYKCCRRFYLLTTLDCFKKKSRGCGNCKVLKT